MLAAMTCSMVARPALCRASVDQRGNTSATTNGGDDDGRAESTTQSPTAGSGSPAAVVSRSGVSTTHRSRSTRTTRAGVRSSGANEANSAATRSLQPTERRWPGTAPRAAMDLGKRDPEERNQATRSPEERAHPPGSGGNADGTDGDESAPEGAARRKLGSHARPPLRSVACCSGRSRRDATGWCPPRPRCSPRRRAAAPGLRSRQARRSATVSPDRTPRRRRRCAGRPTRGCRPAPDERDDIQALGAPTLEHRDGSWIVGLRGDQHRGATVAASGERRRCREAGHGTGWHDDAAGLRGREGSRDPEPGRAGVSRDQPAGRQCCRKIGGRRAAVNGRRSDV